MAKGIYRDRFGAIVHATGYFDDRSAIDAWFAEH
jgi:hypothetical protein